MHTPHEFRVDVDAAGDTRHAGVTALRYPAIAEAPCATLVLAHGAGAGQHSPFMIDFARGLAEIGVEVVTFNFLYTEQRRRVPDRQPLLEACYLSVLKAVIGHRDRQTRHVFIGGKSMGGRIATHIAASAQPDRGSAPDPGSVARGGPNGHPSAGAALGTPPAPRRSLADISGLVLLGYPLHPPGKPEQRRDRHLVLVRRPMLFVQGSRDTFGTPVELELIAAALSPPGTLHIVDGGDHSFKRPGAKGDSQTSVYRDVQRAVGEWIRHVVRNPSTSSLVQPSK